MIRTKFSGKLLHAAAAIGIVTADPLALTLLIQGYVSVRIGIMEARSQRDLGIAGIIAAMLVIKGATWAFGVGILLCVLIYGKRFFSGEVDKTFVKDWDEASQPVEDPEPEVPLRK
jgi:ABC-type microcin C transport system permease subunit YejB